MESAKHKFQVPLASKVTGAAAGTGTAVVSIFIAKISSG
jgi:hypothetical protein